MAQPYRLPEAFARVARAYLAQQIQRVQARAEAQTFARRVLADASLAPLSPGEMPPPAGANPTATAAEMRAASDRDRQYNEYLLANDGYGQDWPPDSFERTVDDPNNPWI